MTREIDPEPCSIGLDTIVAYLERMRRPRMAEFARTLLRQEQQHAAERMSWAERERRLLSRLDAYEPLRCTLVQRQPDYTPPPEASD